MYFSDFVMLVKKMRDVQSEYFKTRGKYELKEVKKYEKLVDEAIRDFKIEPKINEENLGIKLKQGDLFL